LCSDSQALEEETKKLQDGLKPKVNQLHKMEGELGIRPLQCSAFRPPQCSGPHSIQTRVFNIQATTVFSIQATTVFSIQATTAFRPPLCSQHSGHTVFTAFRPPLCSQHSGHHCVHSIQATTVFTAFKPGLLPLVLVLDNALLRPCGGSMKGVSLHQHSGHHSVQATTVFSIQATNIRATTVFRPLQYSGYYLLSIQATTASRP
jgi:hypothetical protein